MTLLRAGDGQEYAEEVIDLYEGKIKWLLPEL